jgi:hypothetical protein
MGFLASALSAIPSAATNRYSLIAYALALVAYILTIWRVQRNKNLLEALQKLPAKDRIGALETEMGGVRLAEGISAEQWLRSRINKYYLLAFLATCIVVVVIFAIAATAGGDPNSNTFEDATGTIAQPRDRGVVKRSFEVSGIEHNVGKGVYLWIAVEIDGKIWPKEGRVTIDDNGQWSVLVFEDGHPNQFGLSLWAANAAANIQLHQWLDRSSDTGDYPAFQLVRGMARLDRVQGLRLAGNQH